MPATGAIDDGVIVVVGVLLGEGDLVEGIFEEGIFEEGIFEEGIFVEGILVGLLVGTQSDSLAPVSEIAFVLLKMGSTSSSTASSSIVGTTTMVV